jgi:P4 family phage/plasmid primase-like protien
MSGDHEKESAPRRETEGAQENCGDSVPSENNPVIPGIGGEGYGGALVRAALRLFHPEGPWHVSAKRGAGFTGAAFGPDADGGAAGWAVAQNRTLNAYVSIAALRPGFRGDKAKKADVASVGWLWVDLDPRAGEDPEAERARILALLTTNLPKGVPPPSVIIDSGRGFWGLWRLAQPVVMPPADDPAWDAARATVEDRNRGLEFAFKADACHNIERVCRLPGTVNRKPGGRLARVLRADESVFDLTAFPAVPDPKAAGAATVAGRSAPVAAPVGRVNLDDLAGVSDRTRALIVQGRDPDDPARWADRSALVLHVLCDLIRSDVPDGDMLAVILDPDFGVSAHVREQPKPESYARRQVQRALERQPRPGPVVVAVPLNLARAFRDARRPHLLHHQQEFLDWDGAAYGAVADDAVRADVWTFLETCRVEGEKGEAPKPLHPNSKVVSGAVDALKAVVHLSPPRDAARVVRWLDGRDGPDPAELVPSPGGVLNLRTGDLMPATPMLFTRTALDFTPDPAAPEPVLWLKFLGQVWPDDDDPACIAALQEFMGYLLTPDTRLQKALMMVGPPRSGKGTILKVMTQLAGVGNTTSPSMVSLSNGRFGLAPLLHKTLMTVSDMRIAPKTDIAALEENLLRITGEDRTSVDRKGISAVEVRLTVRMAIATNELPRFADVSGALARRFITLAMRQSFAGREDTGLESKLMAELPGILNWAVAGWRSVRANKRIEEPKSSRDAAVDLVDLASPVPGFVDECCVLGSGCEADKAELFNVFRAWFKDRFGDEWHSGEVHFYRALYACQPGVGPKRGQRDGDRVRRVKGVRLNDFWAKGRIGGRAG